GSLVAARVRVCVGRIRGGRWRSVPEEPGILKGCEPRGGGAVKPYGVPDEDVLRYRAAHGIEARARHAVLGGRPSRECGEHQRDDGKQRDCQPAYTPEAASSRDFAYLVTHCPVNASARVILRGPTLLRNSRRCLPGRAAHHH